MKYCRYPIAALLAAGIATPATAQVFVDVFAGRSHPERTPVTLTAGEARINDTIVPADLRVDIDSVHPTNSTIYGARAGYWFDWVGVAVDASSLDPDIRRQTVRATARLRFDEEVFGERVVIDPSQDVAVDIPRVTVPTTVTIAALAMMRRPTGVVQPYAFAGPAYLVTDAKFGGSWGVRAGGGAAVPLNRRIALFGEYRYTGAQADAVAGRVGGSVRGVEGDSGDIRARASLRNHSAVGGLRLTL